MNFCLGRCLLELAQEPSRVALALHKAGSSTPFGVTVGKAGGVNEVNKLMGSKTKY